MIDFHSHILPNVDDGSESLDMSLEMVNNALNQGTEYICATPHYITGEQEITRELYESKINELRSKLSNANIMSGLEVYINPQLPTLYKEGKIWCINDAKYMLIELPMRDFPIYTEDVFYELRLLGVTPIIAHPERNLSIMKNEELLISLVNQGTIIQMNAGSLTGLYGAPIKKFAEQLLSKNLVHIIGSDGHNNRRRLTDTKEALQIIKNKNEEVYQWINNNELNILNGKEVEILNITKKKERKLFGIFKI